MSRYDVTTKGDEPTQFSYGFDDCGLPGYFLSDDNSDYDTRDFMADDGCHVSRGRILEDLVRLKGEGAKVPQAHLDAIAMDLPF